MRYLLIFSAISASLLPLEADTITLDFEDLTDSTPVTNQYAGLTFSNTTVLTAGISLNEYEFPPHSGSNVVFDDGGPISIFSGNALLSFSAYFTYTETLTLTAFDSLGDIIGSATSAFSDNQACIDGPPCQGYPGSSPNEFIQLAFDQPFVHITIQGNPGGSSFTMDDATFTSSAPASPEPPAAALAAAALAFFTIRKQQLRYLIYTAVKRLTLLLALLLVIGAVIAMRPANIPTIPTPTVTPSVITAGTSTLVTITVPISDPTLTPGSVNLINLAASGAQPTILGQLNDDGTNGDQLAGDNIYTIQYPFTESSAGELQLEISAAFRGQLKRILSPIVTLSVWGDLVDQTSGIQVLYPPGVYNATNSDIIHDDTTNAPLADTFLLSSSPLGVNDGAGGPDPDLSSTGFNIYISYAPYSGVFDPAGWISSQDPDRPYSSLTPVSIGGATGYEFDFTDDQPGSDEPRVIVYHDQDVFTIFYSSTYPYASSDDQFGLNVFSTIIDNFTFLQ